MQQMTNGLCREGSKASYSLVIDQWCVLGERRRGGTCVYCFCGTLLCLRSYVSLSALIVCTSTSAIPRTGRLKFTFEYPTVRDVRRGAVSQCHEWFSICILKSGCSGFSIQQIRQAPPMSPQHFLSPYTLQDAVLSELMSAKLLAQCLTHKNSHYYH